MAGIETLEAGMRLMQLFLAVIVAFVPGAAGAAGKPTRLTVMSFNTWGLGKLAGQPVEKVAEAIKAAGADIVGIEETRVESPPEGTPAEPVPEFGYGDSHAAELGNALGWNIVDQIPQKSTFKAAGIWSSAVASRFPITGKTKNQLGVFLNVDGRRIAIFNVHFNDSPYQPYQVLNIPYGEFPFIKTEAEAIKFAKEARGEGLALLLEDLKEAADAEAVFVTGDFNEPSWRDWTAKAVAAGQQPVKVGFPTAKAIEAAGFTDALRVAFPDEVAKPAFTWTPTTDPASKDDHHDRIDFVFARAPNLKVISAAIIGEKKPEADVVVTPWPSDHRAVAATVEF